MTAALAAELAQIKDRLDALLDRDPGPVLRARILAARQAAAAARDEAFLEAARPPPDGDPHDLDHIV
jgi:hypothetical protein